MAKMKGEIKMLLADSPTMGALFMAKKVRTDPKSDPPKNVKLSARTAHMLAEIAEATGKAQHEIADRLFTPNLEAEWRAIQPALKDVRAQKAKLQAIRDRAAAARQSASAG